MSLQFTEGNNIVPIEKLKPGFVDPGFNGCVHSERVIPFTIADPPNFHKTESAMSSGFIKLQRAAEDLFEKDLDVFLLLTQIAFRALRQDSKFNKHDLKPNEALIGDFESCHLTRHRYRAAQHRIQHIYQIATFRKTNKGTIATIINTDVYDINCVSEKPAEKPTKNQQKTTKEEVKNISSPSSKIPASKSKKLPEPAKRKMDPTLRAKIQETIRVAQENEFPFPPGRITQLCKQFDVPSVRQAIVDFVDDASLKEKEPEMLKGLIYNNIKSIYEYKTEIENVNNAP